MRPYLIVAGDFVRTGGMDMANFSLADYLARQGHEVNLVAHRAAEELIALPNVRFHKVPKLADSYFLSASLLNRKGHRLAAQVTARHGRVIVNGGNCSFNDINWVHYIHAAHQPLIRKRNIRALKSRMAHRRALNDERAAILSARLVIANSDRTRADAIELLGAREQRVCTVYYGIDQQRFCPVIKGERSRLRRETFCLPEHNPVVAFVGALGDRRKGFDTLFKAWKGLCADQKWDANLVVIGTGAELEHWKTRTKDACLGSRIRFLGFRGDVPELLPACDALVAPARYEAYGLGVHEALCCGLPAIVSSSAGVAERYPQALQDLLINDPDDPDELAMRLLNWRDNLERMRTEAELVSKELRQLTWGKMAAQIVSLIEGTAV